MRRPALTALILPFLLALSVLYVTRAASAAGPPPAVKGRTIGETFDGERTVYDIGIWLFNKVAVGELSLEKEEE